MRYFTLTRGAWVTSTHYATESFYGELISIILFERGLFEGQPVKLFLALVGFPGATMKSAGDIGAIAVGTKYTGIDTNQVTRFD